MSLLPKSKKKLSSRRQIDIKEVRDGILVLPRNQYCTIVETSSINFELKSEAEQDVLIESYQNFINSLPCSLQILVRVREMDVDQYLNNIYKNSDCEPEEIYNEQSNNYAEFIRTLISGNKILSRKFYIIIPYRASGKVDFQLIKEQLLLNQDIVIKGLEKMGMKAKILNSIEILNLFYSFYSSGKYKLQELKSQTVETLLKQNYAF